MRSAVRKSANVRPRNVWAYCFLPVTPRTPTMRQRFASPPLMASAFYVAEACGAAIVSRWCVTYRSWCMCQLSRLWMPWCASQRPLRSGSGDNNMQWIVPQLGTIGMWPMKRCRETTAGRPSKHGGHQVSCRTVAASSSCNGSIGCNESLTTCQLLASAPTGRAVCTS